MKPNELDQSLAQFRDTMPRMWWAIFTGCLEAGFKELEALELVKSYLTATVYAAAATRPKEE